MGATLAFLLLTTVFLLCLRAMKCNKTSIINNGGTALFLSELVFILGINQADNPVIIRVMLFISRTFTFAFSAVGHLKSGEIDF